jgi:hypothetical protein
MLGRSGAPLRIGRNRLAGSGSNVGVGGRGIFGGTLRETLRGASGGGSTNAWLGGGAPGDL